MALLRLLACLATVALATNEAGTAFLEQNAKQEGVITLPSGLQVKIIGYCCCRCCCQNRWLLLSLLLLMMLLSLLLLVVLRQVLVGAGGPGDVGERAQEGQHFKSSCEIAV